MTQVNSRYTYWKKYSGDESEDYEYVIVGSESVGHAHYHHRPLTDQKDRFTSELVRQMSAYYSTKHNAKDEYCLCEVLEVCTITD